MFPSTATGTTSLLKIFPAAIMGSPQGWDGPSAIDESALIALDLVKIGYHHRAIALRFVKRS
jgi:hypothetical protein